MSKQIQFDDDARQALRRGVEQLADRFENMGAQLAREVAVKTGEVAGDGTTTATVLAQEIVSRGLRATAAGHHPMALKRGIDSAVSLAVAQLKAMSRPIERREDIERVARVSSGDDAALAALVAAAMDRVGRG